MTTTSTAPPVTRSAPEDAIAVLDADHKAVNRLFAQYDATRSIPGRKALVAEICTTLTVHVQIAEEIFYPAVKDALAGKLLAAESTVEHAAVKRLIAQLEEAEADGEKYDAKVRVLSEYVKHHVKEEQSEVFPKAKRSSLDLDELGARMAARRDDLLARAA